MYIDFDTIILISKVIGALAVIGGVFLAIYKVFQAPKNNAADVAELKETHTKDIKAIQEELCVMNYALLATLDGLMQLHCNGNVSKAHDMLSKHLNKQAHEQI